MQVITFINDDGKAAIRGQSHTLDVVPSGQGQCVRSVAEKKKKTSAQWVSCQQTRESGATHRWPSSDPSPRGVGHITGTRVHQPSNPSHVPRIQESLEKEVWQEKDNDHGGKYFFFKWENVWKEKSRQ